MDDCLQAMLDEHRLLEYRWNDVAAAVEEIAARHCAIA